jgi:hypothetical protein
VANVESEGGKANERLKQVLQPPEQLASKVEDAVIEEYD